MYQIALRNFVVTAGLLLPTILLNIPQSLAHQLDFRFHNRTRFPIAKLCVSPSNSDRWGADVLGRDILPSGYSTLIQFSGNYNTCLFDIKTVFQNGSYVEREGFNLCQLTDVTLP